MARHELRVYEYETADGEVIRAVAAPSNWTEFLSAAKTEKAPGALELEEIAGSIDCLIARFVEAENRGWVLFDPNVRLA